MEEETDRQIQSGEERSVAETGEGPGETVQGGNEYRQRRIAHFIGHLSDEDEVTRWRSAEELGRIGDPGAVDPLIDTLWDDDARVRLKAAWALGMIGDARAIPALRRLYRIEKEGTREIIKEAMEAIARHDSAG